jgi:dihydropteroate synthase
MGIINITPDSFSDGGETIDATSAIKKTEGLISQGVDIIDLGAESTRPGAKPIDAKTEIQRLLPIIKALREKFPKLALSVDTYKAAVAEVAIKAGADIINDVEGARFEANNQESPMARICARLNCPLILMHRRATVIDEKDFWPNFLSEIKTSIKLARSAGIAPEQIWVDPGFGFGKTPNQNLLLVRNLEKIAALGFPVLLGASRKSTLGLVLNESDPLKREAGNEVTAAWGIAKGCRMIRAHEFSHLAAVIKMADTLKDSPNWAPPAP